MRLFLYQTGPPTVKFFDSDEALLHEIPDIIAEALTETLDGIEGFIQQLEVDVLSC